MEVQEEGGGSSWRLTRVYGEAQAEMKFKTWALLRTLHAQHRPVMAWLCLGDFDIASV
jgi:hypothetical protein